MERTPTPSERAVMRHAEAVAEELTRNLRLDTPFLEPAMSLEAAVEALAADARQLRALARLATR